MTPNYPKSILLVLILCFSFYSVHSQSAEYVPGQVLIKFKEGKSDSQRRGLRSQMRGTTLNTFPALGIELWEINGSRTKEDIQSLINQYKKDPSIEFIEPNYILSIIDTMPSDPSLDDLWGMNNTGQNGGTADADIDAPEAWAMTSESPGVVVAIIDTGIDWAHEDLVDNIWQNLGEDADGDGHVLEWNGTKWIFDPGDENNIDDDGNGYIDDFVGWDFVQNDNNPYDGNSHGTHVAGTVGAVGDNAIGVVGVTWKVQLAALKFLSDRGSGNVANAVKAINYAVAMGMPISNNSWGGGPANNSMYQALQHADADGHLFIAAAGNSFRNDNDVRPFYPCGYDTDNIVSVASTDFYDGLSSFSNVGATTVDLGAPGTKIYSCVRNNRYDIKSGTSMAAPHVAGACALVWGQYPSKTAVEIKAALLNSTDKLSTLTGLCLSEGRLNVHNALNYLANPPSPLSECRYHDSLSLVTLYNSTKGPAWTTTWNLNLPMDNWHGVTLNENGCVAQLELDSNNLRDSIPDELGVLAHLEILNFNNNNLIGSIPPTLGNSRQLKSIDISQNNLSGSIPSSLSYMPNATHLKLHTNQLSGHIPPSFGNLVSLERLELQANNLEGSIPWQLGNLENANYLFLNNNMLSGRIPGHFGKLGELVELDLSQNNLSGSIPAQFDKMDALRKLVLQNNQLSGCYKFELDVLCSRLNTEFNANYYISRGNNFDGPWEDFCSIRSGGCPIDNSCRYTDSLALVSLFDSASGSGWRTTWDLYAPIDTWHGVALNEESCVVDLFLGVNILSGTIPPELANLNSLERITLHENNMTGSIPAELGNMSNLKHLVLANNNLSGPIPDKLSNLTNLSYLALNGNELTGVIPSSFGNLIKLTDLLLYSNQLEGRIPTSLSTLNMLDRLMLSHNELDGPIPPQLGNLENLIELNLKDNFLSGPIPPSLGNQGRLERLGISGNKLTGSIPLELTNLTNLEYLSIYNNQLSGCYESDLTPLCSSFPRYNDNFFISNGNNFDAPWEDFCASSAGVCADNNCRYVDSLTLVTFYTTTDGPNWKNSWDLTEPIHEWHGVTLDDNECVKEIILGANQISGPIPPELGNLNSMERLALHSNSLTGSIPAELSHLSRLKHLALSYNDLVGPIPTELGELSHLLNMSLGNNNLSGSIPASFGDLSQLTNLLLNSNQLSGPIPSSLGNLNNLDRLYLYSNNLVGNIPPQLGNLENLTELNVQINDLTGSIPPELSSLIQLEKLVLGRNKLSGQIPADFGNLSDLTLFSLANNQLSGCYDASLQGLCSSLTPGYNTNGFISNGNDFEASWEDFCSSRAGECIVYNCRTADSLTLVTLYHATDGPNWKTSWDLNQPIDTWHGVTLNEEECVVKLILGYNQLSGPLPSELIQLNSLNRLALHNNNLTGQIPVSFGNFNQLQYLILSNNNLSGNIPPALSQLSDLIYLSLSGNELSGGIPTSFGNFSMLTDLRLNSNQLSGNIPTSLSNLSKLDILVLSSNNLSGSIPPEIGNLSNLSELTLRSNNLSGPLPPELANLSNLEKLGLSQNSLSGSLPREFAQLTNLIILSISNNQLSGCYELELQSLCSSLSPGYNDNLFISNGNNFDADWEDFCSNGVGTCGAGSLVWPGDFNNDGIADNTDLLYWGLAEANTGPVRSSANTNWVGQASTNWSQLINNINGKHQDADGNGIVNSQDLQALVNNYNNTSELKDILSSASTVNFRLEPIGHASDGTTTTFEYALYAEQDGGPANIHGAAFEIVFNAINLMDAQLDITNSSLEPDEVLILSEGNTIDIALTRTDLVNKVCTAPIATLSAAVATSDLVDGQPYKLSTAGGQMIQADGTILFASSRTLFDLYTTNQASPNNMLLTGSVEHIQCLAAGSAEVYIEGGVANYAIQWNTGMTTSQITDLSPGIYTVTVSDANGHSKSLSLEVEGQYLPIYDEYGNQLSCIEFACPTVIDFKGSLPDGTHHARAAIHTDAQVESGFNPILKAGYVVNLLQGFSVQVGSTFSVEIEGCEN